MSRSGFSRIRLGRMHDVMARHVALSDAPGIVTALRRHGEVHVDAIGTKAVGGAEPMRRDTIFRITSMTKPVTAVAAMIPVEECKLRLDEPVDRLLPELADRKVLKRLDAPLGDTVPAHRAITLRDLLTFRLGLGIIMEPSADYPIQKALNELQVVGFGPPNVATVRPRRVDAPAGHAAVDAPTGREVDVQHGVLRARRADRAGRGPAAGGVLPRAHLRAARHEGHELQRAAREARPARAELLAA